MAANLQPVPARIEIIGAFAGVVRDATSTPCYYPADIVRDEYLQVSRRQRSSR